MARKTPFWRGVWLLLVPITSLMVTSLQAFQGKSTIEFNFAIFETVSTFKQQNRTPDSGPLNSSFGRLGSDFSKLFCSRSGFHSLRIYKIELDL
ncbi:hypothetical protein MTP99_015297 [Tenebrio molitor]|nr:hypothetical protein MTP99_015297 [Tenebrio molitor]